MIRPEQLSRKKYNTGGEIGSAIGSTAAFIPGVGPIAAPVVGAVGSAIGGKLGSLIGGKKKPKQPAVTTGTTMGYKYGGKYKRHLRYQVGGTLPSAAQPIGPDAVKYKGPKHEQGGIPIDQSGNPTNDNNAIAEVEGEETRQGDYIFSDELMVPESDMTFAQAHEMLLQQGAGEEQIEQLAQMQEQIKQQEGVGEAPPTQQPQQAVPMKDGGKLPKHQFGTDDFTKRDGYVSPFDQDLTDKFKFFKPEQESNDFKFYEHPGVGQPSSSNRTRDRRAVNRGRRPQTTSSASGRPSAPNVRPQDNVMMPTTAEVYGLDGVKSNRTIEPQPFTNRVNTEAVEQASAPVENVAKGGEEGNSFDWASTAQRVLPSVTRLATAAFAPKPKETPKMQAQTIDERNPAFAAGRNQLASGFRANPDQGSYAQYTQGVNQLTASEAQDRSRREQFNAQAQTRADQFNIQNKVADNERTAQDTAARIKLINDAIQGPLDQIAADRRGKDQMRSMIATSAAQIQNSTDRAEFLNQVLSLIEGGETAEKAIEQARQNYPTN